MAVSQPAPTQLEHHHYYVSGSELAQGSLKLDLEHEWSELILSWETGASDEGGLSFWVDLPNGESFCLGHWALGNGKRESVNQQRTDSGRVMTDILVVDPPQRDFVLRVEPSGEAPPSLERLNLVASRRVPAQEIEEKAASFSPLPVPERYQIDYPNGNVLCSPTSLSMILAYWAEKLDQPRLDKDVPEVVANVFDPEWGNGGTGNWPFNTAYGAVQPGLTGQVARLSGMDELQEWVEADVPVAISVSASMLRGDEPGPGDGHLIVVVGFNEEGDLIVNDPGRSQVRRTYLREHVRGAWATSENTVYLVYPNTWNVPDLFKPILASSHN